MHEVTSWIVQFIYLAKNQNPEKLAISESAARIQALVPSAINQTSRSLG